MEEPRCYRIAPEYRRSLIYVIASLFVLVPVGAAVHAFVRQRPVGNLVGCCAIVVVMVLAALVPFRWMLCVDQQGLARRRLFWWDRWDWPDLASGHVEKRYPLTLVDPRRPWWRRKLSFDYLTSGDRQNVLDRINEHYRLPPPPPVPETLRIKYGDFFRRRATFDGNGIAILTRGRSRAFLWDEVRRVHVTRLDPVRRDFVLLEIFLPEEIIELRFHQGNPMWRGATAEEINEFLFAHLSSERIQEDVVGSPVATREDAQRALEAVRKYQQGFRIAVGIFGSLLVVALAWMAFENGILMAALMTAMSSSVLVPVVWYMVRESCKRMTRLEAALAAFQEADPPTRQTQ